MTSSDRTPPLDHVQRWAADPDRKPCIMLSGGTGTGKTVACAWYLLEHGALYIRAEALTHVFFGHFEAERDEQTRLLGCKSLLIDDLGTERDQMTMLVALGEVLEARKSGATTTLISTNMSRAKLLERYNSPRIASRMEETVKSGSVRYHRPAPRRPSLGATVVGKIREQNTAPVSSLFAAR